MTEKEIQHLKALVERYLDELDDFKKDELYGTERGVHQSMIEDFLIWLEE